jgi:hypothetical protein
MPKYAFTLTRDVTESVRVEINAKSIEDAHEQALMNPPKAGWEMDDNTPQDPYLPDKEDYEEIE